MTQPKRSRSNRGGTSAPLEVVLGRFEVRVGSAIGKKRLIDSQRRQDVAAQARPGVGLRPSVGQDVREKKGDAALRPLFLPILTKIMSFGCAIIAFLSWLKLLHSNFECV